MSITFISNLGNFSPQHSTFSRHLHLPNSVPFSLCLPLHSHLVFVWFSLLFLSLTLELKLYGIFSHYSQLQIGIISSIAIMGGMVVVASDSYRGSPGSLLRSSQHKTLHSHFFTISLASIFSSALSTYVLVSPCRAFCVYPCNVFEYLHPSSPSATTASHFVHSLVEQLMPGKCISAVL